MVTRTELLPIIRQCQLMDLPHSTFYHLPTPGSEADLASMKLIDRCHMELPFYGSRRMVDWLGDEGHLVNRKRVQRLMRTMGIVAVYPKKNLSQLNQAHRVYPYLLRNLKVDHPNQVWATDITHLPMTRGFVYLVTVINW
jgi:putative transposase